MTADRQREELVGAWKVLRRRWEAAREAWRDRVRRRFEKEVWEQFEREVPEALERMERLSQEAKRIHERLED